MTPRYRVEPPANRKYVRELLAQLPDGFQIGMVREVSDGTRPARLINKGHPLVVTPDGELLRGADGRTVHVSGTPSSKRSFQEDLKSIRRALNETEER